LIPGPASPACLVVDDPVAIALRRVFAHPLTRLERALTAKTPLAVKGNALIHRTGLDVMPARNLVGAHQVAALLEDDEEEEDDDHAHFVGRQHLGACGDLRRHAVMIRGELGLGLGIDNLFL